MAQQGRINFGIGFQVDKTGLNDFKRSITEIQGLVAKDIKMPGLNTEQATQQLQNVQQEAVKLERALQKSYNIKLGTYDGEKFNKLLEDQGTNLENVKKSLLSIGAVGQKTWNNFSSTFTNINKELTTTKGLLDKIGDTLFNTIKWSIASSAVNAFTGSIEKAYGYVQKLDTSLNDIRIVTSKSANDMRQFAQEANKAAQALGATTTDYTNASLIYYQQGLSDQEVRARTETTVKVANVTGQSAAETSDQLTAIWNGYKVSAQEAELYIDKVSAVAARTGADLEELSEGMGKVASAANSMGVDIDQLNAMLSTVITVTREDASAVGTAFKTIFARMGDLVVDGEDEFGTKLGDVSGQLQQMGINIIDTKGNMRDMGDVMEEVASKWDTWTEAQQRAAAIALAGKRQYNNLIALFDNWQEMYEPAKSVSATGAGTLEKQQKIYEESLEASLNKMTAAAQGIYDSLFDSESFIEVIDLATQFLGVIENIVDALGGGGQVLRTFGGLLINIFSKKIAVEINNLVNKFHEWRASTQSLTSSLANFDILEKVNKDVNKVTDSALELEKIANRLFKKGFISEDGYERLQGVSKSMIDIANREADLKERKNIADSIVGKGNIDWKAIEEQGGTGVAAQEAKNLLQSDAESIQNLIEGANKYTQQWETLTEFRTKDGRLVKTQLDQQNGLVKTYEEQLAKLKAQEKLDHKAISVAEAELRNAKKLTTELQKQYDAYKKSVDLIKKQTAGISKKDFEGLMQSNAISNQTKDQLQNALAEAESKNAAIFGGNTHQLMGAEGQQAGRAFIEAYIAALQEAQGNVQAAQNAVMDAKAVAEDKARLAAIKDEEALKAARAEGIQQLTQTIGVTMQLTSLMNNFASVVNAFNAGDPGSGLKALVGFGLQLGMILPQTIPLIKKTFTTINEGFKKGASAAKAFQASLGVIGIALMALSLIIEGISMAMDAAAAAEEARLERLQKQSDELTSQVEEKQKLDELYQKYTGLVAQYKETGEQSEELKTATEELCQAFDLEIGAIDKVIGKYDELTEAAIQARLETTKQAFQDAQTAQESNKYILKTEAGIVSSMDSWGNKTEVIKFSGGASNADETKTLNLLTAEFNKILQESDTQFTFSVVPQIGPAVFKKDRSAFTDEDIALLYNTLQTAQQSIQAKALKDPNIANEITYGAFAGGESFSSTLDWINELKDSIGKYNSGKELQNNTMLAYADAILQSEGLTVTDINTADEYTIAKEKMKQRIAALYKQEGIDYTDETLSKDIDEYFSKYSHLENDILNASVKTELKTVLGGEQAKSPIIPTLQLPGSISLAQPQTSKPNLFDVLKIDAYLDELERNNELEIATRALDEFGLTDRTDLTIEQVDTAIKNYKIKTSFSALSAGHIADLQEAVLKGSDFEEKIKELRKNPVFAKALENFENKTLLQQMQTLASLEIQSATSAISYTGDLADLGTDKAAAEFNNLAAAVNAVLYPLSAVQEATGLIGEGFVIAAKDAEKFSTLVPELLSGAVINDDGSIQLDPNIIQSDINKVLEATGQSPEALIAQLETQIQKTSDVVLRAQYTALLSALKQALGFVDTGINEIAGRTGNLANVDYYRVENRKIENLNNQLEKLKRSYDDLAHVDDKLSNLKQQNNLLEENIALLNIKLEKLRQINQQDIQNLIENDMFQANLSQNIFDANGEVNLQIYTQLYEEYLNSEDKKDDPRYQTLFDALDQYIEDFNNINSEIENAIDKQLDNLLEGYQVQLEAIEDLTDKTLKYYDVIEDMNLYNLVTTDYDQADVLNDKANYLITTTLPNLANEITKLKTDSSLTDAQKVDELNTYYETYLDKAQEVYDIIQNLEEEYINSLQERNTLMQEYLGYLDSSISLREQELEITKLLYGEEKYEMFSSSLASATSLAKEKVIAATNDVRVMQEELEKWVEENGGPDPSNETYKALADAAINAASIWAEATTNAIQALQKQMSNDISQAFKQFNLSLYGDLGIFDTSEQFAWIKKTSDQWLDSVNSAFNMRELERSFNKVLNATNKSAAAQQKINQLRNEEINILKAKDKLTKEDFERANKRLSILEAQIALEEARENKNQMRLVRNATTGMYSYQYVADNNAIEEAQAKLDQAQNELYNFDKENYFSNLEEAYDLLSDFETKYIEIINNSNLSTEQKQALIQELINTYGPEIENYADIIGASYGNVTQSAMEMANVVKGLDLSTLLPSSAIQDAINKIAKDGFATVIDPTVTKINDIISTYNTDIEALEKEIIEGYGGNATTLSELFNIIGDKFEEWTQVLKTTVVNLDLKLPEISDDYLKKLATLKSEWETIATKALEYAQALKTEPPFNEKNDDNNSNNSTNSVTSPEPTPSEPELGDPGVELQSDWSLSRFQLHEAQNIFNSQYEYAQGDEIYKMNAARVKNKAFDTEIAAGTKTEQDRQNWIKSLSNYEQRALNDDSFNELMRVLASDSPKLKMFNIINNMSEDEKDALIDWYNNSAPYEPPTEENVKKGSLAVALDWVSRGLDIPDAIVENWINPTGFDTGGYTGAWGSDGRIAMLHEKELVLNQEDTNNILRAVDLVRSLDASITQRLANYMNAIDNFFSMAQLELGAQDFEQNVHITAEFPNATDKNEIEEAFKDLVNLATQKAFENKRI